MIELKSSYNNWKLANRNVSNPQFFYHYERPLEQKDFWDTVKRLHEKGYLTSASLNTIKLRELKDKSKGAAIMGKSYMGWPQTLGEEDPISTKGKVYYQKLLKERKIADIPGLNE